MTKHEAGVLRAVSSFGLCHSFVIRISCFGLCFFPLPMSHSLLNRIWYQFWRHVLQVAAVLMYRVRYSGRENIPASGGVLIVSNHQSHLDPPLVGIGCSRQMNYVARETLFKFPPFRLDSQIGRRRADRPRRPWPARYQGIAQTLEKGAKWC